jgi:hypothetical protein
VPKSKRKTPAKKKPPVKDEAVLDLNVADQEEFERQLLVQAMNLVYGERQAQYGHPYEIYTRVRVMWTGILGIPVSFEQVMYCIIAMKQARELQQPHPDDDNNRDIAGYVGVLDLIKQRQEALRDGSDDSPRAAR